MPESNVKPKKMTIRMLKPGSIYLYIRTNVRRKTREGAGGDEYLLYEYDEKQIKTHFECAEMEEEIERTEANECEQTRLKREVTALMVKDAEARRMISEGLVGDVIIIDRLDKEKDIRLAEGIDASDISAWQAGGIDK